MILSYFPSYEYCIRHSPTLGSLNLQPVLSLNPSKPTKNAPKNKIPNSSKSSEMTSSLNTTKDGSSDSAQNVSSTTNKGEK